MRIALIGTRGPGFYGGFETCVAELAPRLSAMGHEVTVYARRWSASRRWHHPAVRMVVLPSVPTKNLDTISHTALSTAHLVARNRPDVAVYFGVGNSMWAWLARRLGVPVVLNVDGLDRTRAKWGRFARWFLGWSERIAVASCDVLVTDARSIEQYFQDRYGADSQFITYGAPEGPVSTTAALDEAGLHPGGYILYVSRLEPENNAHVLIEAYRRSGVELPLVVVGGAAYGSDYAQRLEAMAAQPSAGEVRMLGFVFGDGYRELQSGATLYVQCTEVGGTHPALVEAMGFGNAVIALDTHEHREVLGDAGCYYDSPEELTRLLGELVASPARRAELAALAAARARQEYSWDAVAEAYVKAGHQALERRRG